MKIIDGKDAVMGRLASYAAKEALRGEEVVVVNCNHVIITGNFSNIRQNFLEKRGRVGSSQKGPKHIKTSERIVKRAIRGMLPNHRWGRGKEALGKIKCYNEVPKEFESKEKISMATKEKIKFNRVKEFAK